jgi:hypothetical protein
LKQGDCEFKASLGCTASLRPHRKLPFQKEKREREGQRKEGRKKRKEGGRERKGKKGGRKEGKKREGGREKKGRKGGRKERNRNSKTIQTIVCTKAQSPTMTIYTHIYLKTNKYLFYR